MGRWRADTLAVNSDPVYWMVVGIARISHEPLDHFMNFMTQVFDERSLDTHGNHLARLVDGRGRGFIDEIVAATF
eukprot:4676012-Alexandrium_andersonii.AAC.1